MPFSIEVFDVSLEWLEPEVSGKDVDIPLEELKQKIDELLVAERLAERYLLAIEKQKGKAVLGLFSGGTPVQGYKRIVELTKERSISWKDVKTFNLDEYEGLPKGHDERYDTFMWRELFSGVGIPAQNVHFPDGDNVDTYDDMISEAGGIDLQGCGIGRNGHLGFNEPGTSRESRTRRVVLDDMTRKANARFFGGDAEKVPKSAFTMGIASILDARKVDVYAIGRIKADTIAKAVMGKVQAQCPASFVQEHPEGKFLLDGAAAAKLDAEKLKKNPNYVALITIGDAPKEIVERALKEF